MIRLVQVIHPRSGRRVAVVHDNELRLLEGADSIYRLAEDALASRRPLARFIRGLPAGETLNYDAVHAGKSAWRLMPSFDHPDAPARCLVTGTGLTHKKSAENRQAMHANPNAPVSDSMKMYQWGVDGGRPKRGQIGVSPEWFYKGCGTILRAHGEPLDVPPFGLDGGDEAEVAGVYLVDPAGAPRRIGLTLANEFSDHEFEEKNYLYLAHSKLRTCSIGPELIVDADFGDARGTVTIRRGRKTIWSKPFATGEKNMSHTVANLEHHHFKYPAHCRPGDAHIYFFGADAFSFGDRVRLEDGDVMEIELAGFGRALRNPIRYSRAKGTLVKVRPV
ncbi:MAG: GguC family protein [Opitutaceae bacterium]|nr:GguC family protein [Opitutaceae bacterium]